MPKRKTLTVNSLGEVDVGGTIVHPQNFDELVSPRQETFIEKVWKLLENPKYNSARFRVRGVYPKIFLCTEFMADSPKHSVDSMRWWEAFYRYMQQMHIRTHPMSNEQVECYLDITNRNDRGIEKAYAKLVLDTDLLWPKYGVHVG